MQEEGGDRVEVDADRGAELLAALLIAMPIPSRLLKLDTRSVFLPGDGSGRSEEVAL